MSSISGREAMYSNASCHCLGVLASANFVDVLGVGADRVRARAEAAIDRTDVQRKEERLVDIAVHQPGDRRVVLLVQRIERQARVIGPAASRRAG